MCDRVVLAGGTVAILCGVSRRRRARCAHCADPAAYACDACDAPLCHRCRIHVPPAQDFCRAHRDAARTAAAALRERGER